MSAALASDGLVLLRQFTQKDYETLLSWVPTVEALFLFSGTNEPWPLTEDDLAQRALHPEIFAWTAVTAADPHRDIGHIEIIRTTPTSGRFARVLIEPESRGKGLARELINAGLDSARTLGLDRIDLNVVVGNEPALRTYRRAGFRMLGVNPDHPSMLQMTLNLERLDAGRGPDDDACHHE